jgi:hypothetical protein
MVAAWRERKGRGSLVLEGYPCPLGDDSVSAVTRSSTSIFQGGTPYLCGYSGASAGMTWLELGVVETVDVADRA